MKILTFNEIDREWRYFNREQKLEYICAFVHTVGKDSWNWKLKRSFGHFCWQLADTEDKTFEDCLAEYQHLKVNDSDISAALRDFNQDGLLHKLETLDETILEMLSREMEDSWAPRGDNQYDDYVLTYSLSNILNLAIKNLKGVLTDEEIDYHFWPFIVQLTLYKFYGYLEKQGGDVTNSYIHFFFRSEIAECSDPKAIDELMAAKVVKLKKGFIKKATLKRFFRQVYVIRKEADWLLKSYVKNDYAELYGFDFGEILTFHECFETFKEYTWSQKLIALRELSNQYRWEMADYIEAAIDYHIWNNDYQFDDDEEKAKAYYNEHLYLNLGTISKVLSYSFKAEAAEVAVLIKKFKGFQKVIAEWDESNAENWQHDGPDYYSYLLSEAITDLLRIGLDKLEDDLSDDDLNHRFIQFALDLTLCDYYKFLEQKEYEMKKVGMHKIFSGPTYKYFKSGQAIDDYMTEAITTVHESNSFFDKVTVRGFFKTFYQLCNRVVILNQIYKTHTDPSNKG